MREAAGGTVEGCHAEGWKCLKFKFKMETLADFGGKILTFINSTDTQHITE